MYCFFEIRKIFFGIICQIFISFILMPLFYRVCRVFKFLKRYYYFIFRVQRGTKISCTCSRTIHIVTLTQNLKPAGSTNASKHE